MQRSSIVSQLDLPVTFFELGSLTEIQQCESTAIDLKRSYNRRALMHAIYSILTSSCTPIKQNDVNINIAFSKDASLIIC